ncbi:MAG: 50S ribosomal protein L15 [Omnitrophica bacterium RIFCSPHIGHO2_02_FULL_49_9]|nr:MAG: 50S ribosomal protein L15 [Omnitrophica bacterium RIFCSPHIGHO2_02_FULL_49_9]
MKSKKPYHKRIKRIGRGPGSGHGKTSTKGHKGQRARSGFTMRPGFEGGQTPFYLRVAKRGFNAPRHRLFAVVNLDQLNLMNVPEVSPELLIEKKIIKRLESGLKILGRGELKKKLVVRAHKFSSHAKEAIERAGGQAVLLKSKQPS